MLPHKSNLVIKFINSWFTSNIVPSCGLYLVFGLAWYTKYYTMLSFISYFSVLSVGFILKKSAKTNGWSRRWFVLNEKTGKVCNTLP